VGTLDLLLLASAVHAGFQITVTLVVYPALVGSRPEDWGAVHDAHSRRIGLVVVAVYGLLAIACLLVLLRGPYGVAPLVAVAAHGVAGLTTALVAAPLHGRLGRVGPRAELLARLLVADRVRAVAALVGLGAALLAWNAS